MGRQRNPGLQVRGRRWVIDKRVGGRRICRSTGTDQLDEAEKVLARLVEQDRQAQIYGVRPSRTFEAAAAKFVMEHKHKRSLYDDIGRLKGLLPWIGPVPIDKLHMGILQPWIADRQAAGRTPATINQGLQIVRRILNLAASEWMDDCGMTWLQAASKIKLLPLVRSRRPYPLDWAEQERLLAELPPHLVEMALFAVNTGCRDQEVCRLLWEWECVVPQLGTSVFIVPGGQVKNGDDRLVVLNAAARGVVEGRRGKHPANVFAYEGQPLDRMLTSAWKRARVRAGLPQVRVHDLKHTFGRRLRAAGVSFEDRQDLLGHKSWRITTHYSAAELTRLVEAVERIVDGGTKGPELVILRGRASIESRKTHADQRTRLATKAAKSLFGLGSGSRT
jgi:integrase